VPKDAALSGIRDITEDSDFEHVAGLVLEGVPGEVFLAFAFDDHFPQGNVSSAKESKQIASRRTKGKGLVRLATIDVRRRQKRRQVLKELLIQEHWRGDRIFD